VSILDAGRVTLYAMQDWIRQLPVQQYWGPQVVAEHFSDDRLASTLDTLWDIGLESTFGQVMSQDRRACQAGCRALAQGHQDHGLEDSLWSAAGVSVDPAWLRSPQGGTGAANQASLARRVVV
jgi:hypothetical protein